MEFVEAVIFLLPMMELIVYVTLASMVLVIIANHAMHLVENAQVLRLINASHVLKLLFNLRKGIAQNQLPVQLDFIKGQMEFVKNVLIIAYIV